ncbi:MAG TPA: outer membrane protein assembly factor BamE [Telluria sp.]|jgi:outer membrane protein assembly factor BamE
MRVDTAVLHRFSLRAPLVAALVCAALAVSGCASGSRARSAPPISSEAGAQTVQASPLQKFFWIFSPYRPDIQQGNFVSKEMLEQLQVGQTKAQVQFILGTPLLIDIFHGERWDYPFYLARGDGELTSARVSVYFKDNKVERFDGGNLPTEKEYIERIAGPTTAAAKEAPKKEDPANMIQIGK